MSTYTSPTFNLAVNIWRWQATVPPSGPALITTVGNLTPGRRARIGFNSEETGTTPIFGYLAGVQWLLLPMSTDIRAGWMIGAGSSHSDIVQLPTYGGNYWGVIDVFDVARGFANEYRTAGLFPISPWALPIP
jgi:hypothetical protein